MSKYDGPEGIAIVYNVNPLISTNFDGRGRDESGTSDWSDLEF